jgi:surface polysaccharide O-acyltransferase-like enzyme
VQLFFEFSGKIFEKTIDKILKSRLKCPIKALDKKENFVYNETGNRQQATGNNRTLLPNRYIFIDLLRIAATFGVIVLHTAASKWYDTPVNSFNWQIMNIYDSLVRWTVPIFVMISGVFHLRPNKAGMSFNDEIKIILKKIVRIICAIIFWGILYNVFNMAGKYFFKNEPITLYSIIKIPGGIILGPPYYHLWFLYMLIGLYLLTPIFRCFVNNCKREHIKYYLVLFFVVGTCFPFINNVLNNFSAFKGKIIYFPVAELTGYIGYYIAGYYFANYEIKNKYKIGIYIFAVLSLLFTIIGTAIISIYKKEPIGELYGYLLPHTMFVAYGVFLFFKDMFEKIKFSDKKIKIISKLSQDTFGMYLIHALVLQIFGTIGLNTLIINPIISIPIIAIMVMIISEIGTMIINKIPKINKYII